MANTQSSATSSGIGLGGGLFLVFVVLKLTGHIGWSWWWVAAPLWAPLTLAVAIGVAFGVILLWPRGRH